MTNNEHPFSWKALARIVTVIAAIYFAMKAADLLVILLISLVIAAALFPLALRIERKLRVRRTLALLVLFTSLLIPFVLVGYIAIPSIVRESPEFISRLGATIESLPFIPESVRDIDIWNYIRTNSSYLIASTKTAAGFLTSAITVVFLAFYFMYDFETLSELFLGLFPAREKDRLKSMFAEIGTMVGHYIRGNVLISLICAAIIYVGLLLLDVPFALPLALIAGVLNLLPVIGSLIAAVPAVIIAFGISPAKGLLVLALYFVYQQIENTVISPAVYNKSLKLSASLSFVSVIIGGSVFGVVGAFLALPVAASIPAIIQYRNMFLGGPKE